MFSAAFLAPLVYASVVFRRYRHSVKYDALPIARSAGSPSSSGWDAETLCNLHRVDPINIDISELRFFGVSDNDTLARTLETSMPPASRPASKDLDGESQTALHVDDRRYVPVARSDEPERRAAAADDTVVGTREDAPRYELFDPPVSCCHPPHLVSGQQYLEEPETANYIEEPETEEIRNGVLPLIVRRGSQNPVQQSQERDDEAEHRATSRTTPVRNNRTNRHRKESSWEEKVRKEKVSLDLLIRMAASRDESM